MAERPRVHVTPAVALVGRKNVGKSSLFNRLIEKNQAIVSSVPGTTRDVGIASCLWRGQLMTLLDTGGLDTIKKDVLETSVRKQALRAAGKAHVILFVGDAKTGPLSTDVMLAKELRKSGRPVVLAVNKADSAGDRRQIGDEWKRLGLGDPIAVSAANGGGTGDLLDKLMEAFKLSDLPETDVEPEVVLAMLGRPNVGKSSLLNAIAGEERVIVSEIPHTTREPQDTLLWYKDRPIMVIDTAGIRKRANVLEGLESTSVAKSLTALKQADVALLVLDVSEGIGTQDAHLAGLAAESGKGIVVVLNKWDLLKDKTVKTGAEARIKFLADMPFLSWAPIAFVSAKTGMRVQGVLDMALRVQAARTRTLTVEELDEFVAKIVKPYLESRISHKKTALGVKRKHTFVYGLRQVKTAPPEFMAVVKDKDFTDANVMRFIENRLRERFDLIGVPVKVSYREIEK